MDRAAREVIRILEQFGQLTWQDAKGKKAFLMVDANARALIGILAKAAEQRGTTGEVATSRGRLDDDLFAALEAAWNNEALAKAEKDQEEDSASGSEDSGVWLLRSVEAVGFGGLNGPASTKPFTVEFGPSDTCIYGGNGSGKTSLISAIAWALTGHRLSDASGLSVTTKASMSPAFSVARSPWRSTCMLTL